MPTPFEHYFATHFQTSLNHVGDEIVFSNGTPISQGSWDRKAAYLLWCEIGRPGSDAVKTGPIKTSTPKIAPEKIADLDDDADFSSEDWDIA